MHDGKVIAIRNAGPAKSLLNNRQNAVLGLATGEQSAFVMEVDHGVGASQRTPFGLATFCDATDVKALGIIDSFHAAAMHPNPAGFMLAGVSSKTRPRRRPVEQWHR